MARLPRLETGYDTAAVTSYKEFCELRRDGVVPERTRFQACLPTATNFIGSYIQPAYQAVVEPHYEQALIRASHNIQ